MGVFSGVVAENMVVVMGNAEKPGGGVISLPLVMLEKKFRRRPTAKGVGLRVADSHTGNHPEDGFTPLETIQRLLVVIGRRLYSGFEGEAFELERRVRHQWAIPLDKGFFEKIPGVDSSWGLTTPGAWFSHDNAKYWSMVRVLMSTPAIVLADI
ncbi:hypothetical protein Tco_0236321, partial [Tanacetum coccineum]